MCHGGGVGGMWAAGTSGYCGYALRRWECTFGVWGGEKISARRAEARRALFICLYGAKLLKLCEFVVGAEHVGDFLAVHFDHHIASGAAVLTRVELSGLLSEGLADASGKGEAAVGVDVDLADGALGGLAELLLGDADGVGELAAILVDDVDVLLWYGR